MLRSIIEHGGKSAPAHMKVTTPAATGMGVVIVNGALTLPAEETAADLYFLQKARVLTGADASRSEVSDYLPAFNAFAANELAIAENYGYGEEFATDQYDATSITTENAGKRVCVGTDGKIKVAGSGIASKYILVGLYNDGSHVLAHIRVSDTASANA